MCTSPPRPSAAATSSLPSSSSPSAPAPASGGSALPPPPPACAACKHQRRKCTPECVLAPYFPASEPSVFRNALRLFGVKNILRILDHVGPARRDEAMRSITFEANIRAAYPVHGCLGVIWQLENQIAAKSNELELARQQVAFWQAQQPLPPTGPYNFFVPPTPHDAPLVPPSPQPLQGGLGYVPYVPYDVKMVEAVVPLNLDVKAEGQEEGSTAAMAATPRGGEGSSSKMATNPKGDI